MEASFTMVEIAQMLGEKDLNMAMMAKQITSLTERNEALLKAKDTLYNELHELKIKKHNPKEVPKTSDVEAKA